MPSAGGKRVHHRDRRCRRLWAVRCKKRGSDCIGIDARQRTDHWRGDHCSAGVECRLPGENVFITEIGDVVAFGQSAAKKEAPIASGSMLVDGLTIGEVTNVVLGWNAVCRGKTCSSPRSAMSSPLGSPLQKKRLRLHRDRCSSTD